jgi:hypothetical protein
MDQSLMTQQSTLECLVTGTSNKASTYYRILAAEPYLSEHYSLRLRRLGSKPWGRWPALLSLPANCTVLLQKHILPDAEWKWLRKRAKHIVFDLDDAIYVGMSSKEMKRFERTLEESNAIICSIEDLKERCLPHNQTIYLSPSPVDTNHYPAISAGKPIQEKFILGWSSSSSGYPFFKTLMPELGDLLKAHPHIELHLLSTRPPRPSESGLDGLPFVFRPFHRESYLEVINEFHAGLMPLIDTEFTRGKCGYKLMQYQMMGVWPIAADIGYNGRVIDEGQSGRLYRDARHFCDCVLESYEAWEKIHPMLHEMRDETVKRFGMPHHVDMLLKALKG